MPPTAGKEDPCYLLCVGGKTYSAPYLTNWQKLKDSIRQHISEQPGWAEVVQQPNGVVHGWCRFTKLEDVKTVFSAYSRSKVVMLHIFSTIQRTPEFTLIRCNCDVIFGMEPQGHSSQRSRITIEDVNQAFSKSCAGLRAPNPVRTHPVYPDPAGYYQEPPYMQTAALDPAFARPVYPDPAGYYQEPPYMQGATLDQVFTQPVYSDPTSYYQELRHMQDSAYSHPTMSTQASAPVESASSQSTSRLPVSLDQGAKATQQRGIFIRNLAYDVTRDELISFLRNYGCKPCKVEIHEKMRGESKGVASVSFRNREEAEESVFRLKNKAIRERRILVRMDTNAVIVDDEIGEPLVVGGSSSRVSQGPARIRSPVVVDGSGSRASQGPARIRSPVVVDGSGSRYRTET